MSYSRPMPNPEFTNPIRCPQVLSGYFSLSAGTLWTCSQACLVCRNIYSRIGWCTDAALVHLTIAPAHREADTFRIGHALISASFSSSFIGRSSHIGTHTEVSSFLHTGLFTWTTLCANNATHCDNCNNQEELHLPSRFI